MSFEDYGLIEAVYVKGAVKIPTSTLRLTKVPAMCPHCLKQGNVQEAFPVSIGNWRINVPFSTHNECRGGFRKRNISGSVRVWGQSGYPDYLCMEFREPLYSLIFTRINFAILHDGKGTRLTDVYERQLRSKQSHYRGKNSCPRCEYQITGQLSECPSCSLDLTQPYDPIKPSQLRAAVADIDVAMVCPHCGISMLQDSRVKKCGRCGGKLDAKSSDIASND